MANVTKDALGTELVQSATASTPFNYTGLTVVSNTNGGIVVTFVVDLNGSATNNFISTVTGYTKINAVNSSGNEHRTELWAKVGNSTGLQTIVITPSSTWSPAGNNVCVSAISVINADQTGGATTFNNATTNTGTGANSTISVTTTAADLAVAVAACNNECNAITKTAIYTFDTGSFSSNGAAYDQGNASSPSVFATTGGTTSVNWDTCGTNIKAVSAGGGGFAVQRQQFKIDKFKTPSRSMGPNAGLFQVKAYPIAVSADTPASYVSRPFPPVQWNLNTPLLRGTAQDFSSSAVETNPHWQGRTYPPQWAITRSLLLPRAVVESSSAVETNPHWKPGTLPPQWFINRLLAQNTAQDFSSSAVETNPHWVARTWPIQWVVNASLVRGVTGDITTVVTTPDAPPPFIPRTWLPQWAINIPLHQNTAQDFSASDVETNPHWQSRSWPVAWSTQAALWQGAASDTPFAVIDTPVYFIPRTFPAQWLPNRALGQNTAQDFSASAVETNVQFRSRTWPLQWALQASLLRGTAQDFSTLPPATQPVYARYGASHGIGALSAIPGEIPS